MSKAVLITRPNHDLITTYFFAWSEEVIKFAKSRGIKVLDLAGKKANEAPYLWINRKYQVLLGNPDSTI